MKKTIGVILFLVGFLLVTADAGDSQVLWSGGCMLAMFAGSRLWTGRRK